MHAILLALQMEGREVSDSEDEIEEEEYDYGAQDAAVQAAQLDGAIVERISSNQAAGDAPQPAEHCGTQDPDQGDTS